jgi:acetylornithine/N-succinyldiaminopimelate aminotransferase
MDEHVIPTYRRAGPVFVSGKGAQLFDAEGRTYLDLLSGIGVTALGHGHPRWSAAVAEQAAGLAHVSNLWRHPYTEEVAARLARLSGLEAVFFSNSGSEAGECALKIARKHQRLNGHSERTGFVALNGGFHGRTFGCLSTTATARYREPFGPGLQATFIEPHDPRALQRALANDPAALILEPVQGEGGLRELDPDWLMLARSLCDETGTLLIADEVQCGCGRTGTFLAGEAAGLRPDIVTLAKPLAAGLPIGATLVRAELAEVLQPGDHGSTFGGGPLALRGALVFLEELEQGGLDQAVRERGAQFAAGLDELVARGLADGRRGRGLMLGLVLPGRAADVQGALLERGLLCGTATGDVLRFLPPYVITAKEVELALELLATTLSETLENPS